MRYILLVASFAFGTGATFWAGALTPPMAGMFFCGGCFMATLLWPPHEERPKVN